MLGGAEVEHELFPHPRARGWILGAKERRRMPSREPRRRVREREDLPAVLADRAGLAEERRRRSRAETADDLGAKRVELGVEPSATGLDFRPRRPRMDSPLAARLELE